MNELKNLLYELASCNVPRVYEERFSNRRIAVNVKPTIFYLCVFKYSAINISEAFYKTGLNCGNKVVLVEDLKKTF